MRQLKLPDNYMIARYIHYSEELLKLPSITKGKYYGAPVYRIKINGKYHRFSEYGDRGPELRKIFLKRNAYIEEISELEKRFKGDIKTVSSDYFISSNKESFLNKQFYMNTDPNASPYKNEYRYELNGIRYRSRGELMVAQVLTDMGLEFKYECPIVCSDVGYTADFLVYLPEFNRCFIIEYLGRLDDDNYIIKNSVKIRDYMKSGIYIGRDLAVLCGSMYETPTEEQIYNAVSYLLNNLTTHYLVKAGAL